MNPIHPRVKRERTDDNQGNAPAAKRLSVAPKIMVDRGTEPSPLRLDVDPTKLPTNPYVFGSDCCQASHVLKDEDRDNFGRLYKDGQLAARSFTFLPLCKGCLFAKFGLIEDTAATANNLQCYFARKTSANSCHLGREGPFLRAYKTTENLYRQNVVFEKNTVILPVGQLLIDIFMMEPGILFLRDFNTVQLKLNYDPNPYNVNNYLYLYFKMLHQLYVSKVNVSSKRAVRNADEFTDQQYSVVHHMLQDGHAEASYKSEAFLLGNLINPSSGVSVYVTEGNRIEYAQDRTVYVDVKDHTPQTLEPVLDEDSHYATTVIHNHKSSIPLLDQQDVRNVNNWAFADTNNFHTFVHSRKESLLAYFEEDVNDKLHLDKIYSAIGLHLAHMCVPSHIVDKTWSNTEPTYTVLRSLKPNVKYVEGLGLISTKTICVGDFLVINMATTIDRFMATKGSNSPNAIFYNKGPAHFGKKESQTVRSGPILNSIYYAGM